MQKIKIHQFKNALDIITLLCDKKFVNRISNVIFKDEIGLSISNYLFENEKEVRISLKDLYKHFSGITDENDPNIQRISNKRLQQEFIFYVTGDFLCNTLTMGSSYCNEIREWHKKGESEQKLRDFVSNYYFQHFCYIPSYINPPQYTMSILPILSGIKIPNSIHYIWATSINKTKQISAKNLQTVKDNIDRACDTEFILWVSDANLLFPSVRDAKQLGIVVKEFKDLYIWNKISYSIDSAISSFQYGIVSDLMRYAVLLEEGGVYLDFDYKLINNLRPLLSYDLFVMDLDSGTASSFLGSVPYHIILDTAIEMSLYSLRESEDILPYPQECFGRCNVSFVMAGPTAFKIAYSQISNYYTYDIQVPLSLAENYKCGLSNTCIQNDIYNPIQNISDHYDCFGYSINHHEGGGASWCIGY